tara:strand:- start:18 stop:356 length:339 start_codon:yes stop_codon:yes gene_type:complete
MALANLSLTSSAQTLLSVPADKTHVITTVIFTNTAVPDPLDDTSGETTLTAHLVESGGSVGAVNMVINSLPIAAGETFVMDTEKLVLEAGDSMQVLSGSPNNLVATLSYVDI